MSIYEARSEQVSNAYTQGNVPSVLTNNVQNKIIPERVDTRHWEDQDVGGWTILKWILEW
jgi:hypothetical protein